MNKTTEYVKNIAASRLSIYDAIDPDDVNLWIPTATLETILNDSLIGENLQWLAIRTRSKVVKQLICRALGYPEPKTFRKTQPRFFGQNFDVYIQKSNNLQIWNEEISLTRRYVLVRVTEQDVIKKVKVVLGEQLAKLDTTGTLTHKYQARLMLDVDPSELVFAGDSAELSALILASKNSSLLEINDDDTLIHQAVSSNSSPTVNNLLTIEQLYERLSPLIGMRFLDTGFDQERNRGMILHRLVCERLGYAQYSDDGHFPDLRHQLLEVKLQTSMTIDLGLVRPDSKELLDITVSDQYHVRPCDVRYAIFHAVFEEGEIILMRLYLTTGENFFGHFPLFQGNVLNKKLQIPLPQDFFS